MTLTIDLPGEIERQLRSELGNLDQFAMEATLVELYRQKKLTHHQLGQALKLDRFQTDGLLKRHGAMLEMTEDEFAAELADLRKLILI